MIILISGKQGSGKTTTSNELVSELNKIGGVVALNLTFAEVIYAMHDYCWGILKEHGIEMPYKKDGYLLQLLGTEWGRKIVDEKIWVKIMRSRIAKLDLIYDPRYIRTYFIISDCRFKNEFDAFKAIAVTIRLFCNRDVRKTRVEMWRDTEEHASETDLDAYADEHRFDLNFNTEVTTTKEIVDKFVLPLLKIREPSGEADKKEG